MHVMIDDHTRLAYAEVLQGQTAIQEAVRAEPLLYSLPGGDPVILYGKSVIAKPLVESDPAILGIQCEGVRRGYLCRPCAGPAQQPVLAVGQDAHTNPALRLRLRQILVELLHVRGIGAGTATVAIWPTRGSAPHLPEVANLLRKGEPLEVPELLEHLCAVGLLGLGAGTA